MSDLINRPEFDSYEFALLQRGHDFGMRLDQGRVAFGKVLDWEDAKLIVGRYGAVTTRSASAAYGSGSSTTWNQWTDVNGHKYFREKQTNYILQVFVGVWPRQLRWWHQYPSSNTIGNLSEIMVDSPALITTPGFIDGIKSPIEDPSRKSEIMVPKELDISHMIFNPTRLTVEPIFSLHIRRCRVYWYDTRKAKDQEAVESFSNFIIHNKGSPVHFYSPGVENFTYGIEQQLAVPPVDIEELAGVKQ